MSFMCTEFCTIFICTTFVFQTRFYSIMPAPVAKNGTAPAFQRLPKTVAPTNYDLTFEPDWTNHSFAATAGIDIQVIGNFIDF